VEECESYTSPSGLYTWTTNGTYQDTIPNSFGCDSTMTIHLTLNNTTSSIAETACFEYTAPDGVTYSTSGNYTAVIPNAAGCDSTISINLTINTVNVGVTQNGFDFVADQSFATYQWLDCENNYAVIPGETGQSFTATNNGSYAVQITDNGCVDTSMCFDVSTIGIIENEDFTQLKVYPNPTSGKVFIQFGKTVESISYTILDAQGRIIDAAHLQDTDEFSIDINSPTGIYFLKIISDETMNQFRIVKN
jgi:hypothetical protein